MAEFVDTSQAHPTPPRRTPPGHGNLRTLIHIRSLRGVSLACPTPVTGRVDSFCRRFRFVGVVRALCAGEAKLRGPIEANVLSAGPLGCEYPGVACLSAYL